MATKNNDTRNNTHENEENNNNNYDSFFARKIAEQKLDSVKNLTEFSLSNPNTVINVTFLGKGN
jgi:hypothetical protein